MHLDIGLRQIILVYYNVFLTCVPAALILLYAQVVLLATFPWEIIVLSVPIPLNVSAAIVQMSINVLPATLDITFKAMEFAKLVLPTVKPAAPTEMVNVPRLKPPQNNLGLESIIKLFQQSVTLDALFAQMKIPAGVSLALQVSLFRLMKLVFLVRRPVKLVLLIMPLLAFLALEMHISIQLPILAICVLLHPTA